MYLQFIAWSLVITSFVECSERRIRAMPFPDDSTVGILAAIATPVESPYGDVIFSYNFEANYNSHSADDLIDLNALKKYDIPPDNVEVGNDGRTLNGVKQTNQTTEKRSIFESFLSRKIVYTFLENKLESFGLKGNACLLKTICQVAEVALGRNNGVLGDLVHVIFTPSTSIDKVSNKYVRAEWEGANVGCHKYQQCPRSILDFMSVTEI